MRVVGRKASCPENPRRLDTTGCKEVAKESRDVSRLGSREVLVARDVLVLATRGCLAAVMAEIIATVELVNIASRSAIVRVSAKLAGASVLIKKEYLGEAMRCGFITGLKREDRMRQAQACQLTVKVKEELHRVRQPEAEAG